MTQRINVSRLKVSLDHLATQHPPHYFEAYLSSNNRHAMDRLTGHEAARDVFGREIMVGDVVVKAGTMSRSAVLEPGCVRQIKNGKVYLSSSPMSFSDRICIIHRADGSVPEMPIEV